MERWVTTLVGLAVVVLAVWLVAHNFQPPTPDRARPVAAPRGVRDGRRGRSDVRAGGRRRQCRERRGAAAAHRSARGPIHGSTRGSAPRCSTGPPVPALPLSVPRQVRFGVVLVSYAGAQPSAAGGSRPPTRSKADAQALAEKLLLTAQQDFHAAVQQGDGGSSDDIGHVKLGVLEPAPEYVLFTLAVDGGGRPGRYAARILDRQEAGVTGVMPPHGRHTESRPCPPSTSDAPTRCPKRRPRSAPRSWRAPCSRSSSWSGAGRGTASSSTHRVVPPRDEGLRRGGRHRGPRADRPAVPPADAQGNHRVQGQREVE